MALRANKDLCDLELSEDKWSSIQLVASWLEKFCDVTTQMSATHWPMLSHTHTIFCGLQEHLRKSLQHLPSGIDLCIRDGLVTAHQKLSEYYYWFDQSPFYIWAAHMLHPSSRHSQSWILVSKDNCVRASHVLVNPACRVSKWTKSQCLA